MWRGLAERFSLGSAAGGIVSLVVTVFGVTVRDLFESLSANGFVELAAAGPDVPMVLDASGNSLDGGCAGDHDERGFAAEACGVADALERAQCDAGFIH